MNIYFVYIFDFISGTKSFVMGDQPVEVDCAMFGMLAQIVWNSPGCPYEPLFIGNGTIIILVNSI